MSMYFWAAQVFRAQYGDLNCYQVNTHRPVCGMLGHSSLYLETSILCLSTVSLRPTSSTHLTTKGLPVTAGFQCQHFLIVCTTSTNILFAISAISGFIYFSLTIRYCKCMLFICVFSSPHAWYRLATISVYTMAACSVMDQNRKGNSFFF